MFLKPLSIACALAFLPALSFAEGTSSSRPVLKVHVTTPASWNLLIDRRAQENLAASVREALATSDLPLAVEPIRLLEDPAAAPARLAIDVKSWRFTDSGDVDCTFSARLVTPEGERPIGDYSSRIPHRAVDLVPYSPTTPKAAFDRSALAALAGDLAKVGTFALTPVAAATSGS